MGVIAVGCYQLYFVYNGRVAFIEEGKNNLGIATLADLVRLFINYDGFEVMGSFEEYLFFTYFVIQFAQENYLIMP